MPMVDLPGMLSMMRTGGRFEGAGDVFGEGGDLGGFDAGGEGEFVKGDDRAGVDGFDLAFDAEGSEGGFEDFGLFADALFLADGIDGLGFVEEVEAGETIVAEVLLLGGGGSGLEGDGGALGGGGLADDGFAIGGGIDGDGGDSYGLVVGGGGRGVEWGLGGILEVGGGVRRGVCVGGAVEPRASARSFAGFFGALVAGEGIEHGAEAVPHAAGGPGGGAGDLLGGHAFADPEHFGGESEDEFIGDEESADDEGGEDDEPGAEVEVVVEDGAEGDAEIAAGIGGGGAAC